MFNKKNKNHKQLSFPNIKPKSCMPSIKIITPIVHKCNPTTEYMESINSLLKQENQLPFKISYESPICDDITISKNTGINGGTDIFTNQKHIIEKLPYDGFLFINSDIKFTANDVMNLIKRNAPIIGAKYQNKTYPDFAKSGYWSQKLGYSPKSNWISITHKGLTKVDWVGSGFLYVSKYVIQNMTYPWFFNTVVNAVSPDGTPISVINSDEFGFAIKAFEIGASIFCDCNIEVKQIL